jgi:hypothetical protein
MDHSHTRGELLGPQYLGGSLGHATRHIQLPAVIDAAHAVALDAAQRQRGPPMGTELIEESDPAVLGPKGDVVLAEQADWRRRVSGHQILRQGERDPVVLSHQPTERCVPLHPGHQLILLPANHGLSSLSK